MAEALYPVFLDLNTQPVLIVGGGDVAWRKTASLLAAGARITVVSPRVLPLFKQTSDIQILDQPYDTRLVLGTAATRWRLIFAATNATVVNQQVGLDAGAAGILCCRCDKPEHGDFVGTSHWRRGCVTVAVSTGGASPTLAAKICHDLGDQVDPALVELAGLMQQWRRQVVLNVPSPTARSKVLRRLSGEPMIAMLERLGSEAANRLAATWIQEAALEPPSPADAPV